MNWIKVAFGLIREAASSEVGQEVIDNIRSTPRREATDTPSSSMVDAEALVAAHRAQVKRNLDTIVEKLNEQSSQLEAAIRRQRRWNYGLVTAVAIAFAVAMIAAM